MLFVWNVMECDVVALPADMAVRDAARLLLERHLHGAPVVDASGRVCSVVSMVDLLRELVREDASADACLCDLVTRPALTIEASSGLYEAAQKMVREDVHRLVVVDSEGKAVGVITPMDVMRAIVNLEGGFHVRPAERRER